MRRTALFICSAIFLTSCGQSAREEATDPTRTEKVTSLSKPLPEHWVGTVTKLIEQSAASSDVQEGIKNSYGGLSADAFASYFAGPDFAKVVREKLGTPVPILYVKAAFPEARTGPNSIIVSVFKSPHELDSYTVTKEFDLKTGEFKTVNKTPTDLGLPIQQLVVSHTDETGMVQGGSFVSIPKTK
ncbi:MAG: hypothetical protein C5B53_09970 [Candidatus Melainabacteria bacterium]|nr:MAG: hypothetical protein C5B53_09970 [Candidatus Melainabacteria bacterium]